MKGVGNEQPDRCRCHRDRGRPVRLICGEAAARPRCEGQARGGEGSSRWPHLVDQDRRARRTDRLRRPMDRRDTRSAARAGRRARPPDGFVREARQRPVRLQRRCGGRGRGPGPDRRELGGRADKVVRAARRGGRSPGLGGAVGFGTCRRARLHDGGAVAGAERPELRGATDPRGHGQHPQWRQHDRGLDGLLGLLRPPGRRDRVAHRDPQRRPGRLVRRWHATGDPADRGQAGSRRPPQLAGDEDRTGPDRCHRLLGRAQA